MDGIKTAIVGFLLVCLILPNIIKNRHQYYAALAMFLIGQLLLVLAQLFSSPTGYSLDKGAYVPALWRLCHTIDGLIDIAVILVLVLASGGLSVRELAGNFAKAYEVIRRGEEEKEVIIPIAGQTPRSYKQQEQEPKRYVIEDTLPGTSAPPPPPPPPAQDKGESGIPLA